VRSVRIMHRSPAPCRWYLAGRRHVERRARASTNNELIVVRRALY
jgi:hypothetical protein